MTAPAYSFDRRKTGAIRARCAGRLTESLVRDIRKWAGREGYFFTLRRKAEILQRAYPLSLMALEELLMNRTWVDPTYRPGEPDETFFDQPTALLVLQAWYASRS